MLGVLRRPSDMASLSSTKVSLLLILHCGLQGIDGHGSHDECFSACRSSETWDCSGSSGRCTPTSSWGSWHEPIFSCPDETLFEYGTQGVALPPPVTDSLMTTACWMARNTPLLKELAQEVPHSSATTRRRIIRYLHCAGTTVLLDKHQDSQGGILQEDAKMEYSPDFDWDHRNCIGSGHCEAGAHDILFDVPDAEILSAPPAPSGGV